MLLVHAPGEGREPPPARPSFVERLGAEHEPSRRVEPVLVVAGVLDVAHERTNADANPKLVAGYPPHRVDEPLAEAYGSAR
jgi:hypothetical protein